MTFIAMQLRSVVHFNPCSPSSAKESLNSSFSHQNRCHGCCIRAPLINNSCSLTLDSHSHILKSAFTNQLWRLPHHRKACGGCLLAGPQFLGLITTRRRVKKRGQIRCSTSSSSPPSEAPSERQFVTLLGRQFRQKDLQLGMMAMATVMLSSSNKVMYKMALVPLKKHPLFLAQLSTVAYVVVYSSILYMRVRAGIVTKEMLAIPKGKFVLIGAVEAIAIALGMASAAVIPGPSIPIFAQVYLVWQLLLSASILKERYTLGQIGGCFLVITGVIVVVASGSGGLEASSLNQAGFFWPCVMMFSTLFSAASSILKEFVFREACDKLKGGNLDIFVVNTLGSICQALFVVLILPLVFKARGVSFPEILLSLRDGYVCFVTGSKLKGCQGAPWVPLLYIAVNMAFNISSLSLLKQSSAIVSTLCITLSIPLSIFAFTFPWPYLGSPAKLPAGFVVGAAILVAGLATYTLNSPSRKGRCSK